MQAQTTGSMGKTVPLYVPCRKLAFSAPFRWLEKGWQDFRRAPWHSLAYGVIFVFSGWLLIYFAWINERDALIFGLPLGFLIMGPVLAFGLYDISYQLEHNRTPSFRHERQKALHEMGHELMFAMMLGMLFVVLSIVLSMVGGVGPILGEKTGAYAVGPLLIAATSAGVAFCTGAFALPMILHRDTDAATAIMTSINAVLRNKGVCALWALLIFALIALGFATALVGLAFIVPVLGYASWHAYRETVPVER